MYQSPTAANLFNGNLIVNSTIPEQTSDAFSSKTLEATIARPMDIQYRDYFFAESENIDGGSPQLIGVFRPLQSFLLEDGYHLIEGLIVDATSGGIGFRNHTIPLGLDLGASWSEDILWIEPVTSCVDTNLTLGFEMQTSTTYTNSFLQDNGGLASLAINPPNPSWDVLNGAAIGWNQSPPVPDLEARAYQAAWWNNRLTELALNITNPTFGQVYSKGLDEYANAYANPSSIGIDVIGGNFLDSNITYPTFILNFISCGEDFFTTTGCVYLADQSPFRRAMFSHGWERISEFQ